MDECEKHSCKAWMQESMGKIALDKVTKSSSWAWTCQPWLKYVWAIATIVITTVMSKKKEKKLKRSTVNSG